MSATEELKRLLHRRAMKKPGDAGELCYELPDGTHGDAALHAEILDDPDLLKYGKEASSDKT